MVPPPQLLEVVVALELENVGHQVDHLHRRTGTLGSRQGIQAQERSTTSTHRLARRAGTRMALEEGTVIRMVVVEGGMVTRMEVVADMVITMIRMGTMTSVVAAAVVGTVIRIRRGLWLPMVAHAGGNFGTCIGSVVGTRRQQVNQP